VSILGHPDDPPRLRLARRLAATPPLAKQLDTELWPGPQLRSDAELADAISAALNVYQHPVGTCRMGPAEDRDAVVDPAGRVHGIQALQVADASIMPTIRRANTNLPTLMLAERIAEAA
jgi:choline dehydrogenase